MTTRLKQTEQQLRTRCVHRYLLGDPREGEVHGRCRHCGSQRSWPAAPAHSTWEQSTADGRELQALARAQAERGTGAVARTAPPRSAPYDDV